MRKINANWHKYANFEDSFLMFSGAKRNKMFSNYYSICNKKMHNTKVRKNEIFFESILFWIKIGYRPILKQVCNTN